MIVTRRLQLIPATAERLRAALAGAPALGAGLAATVPSTWPPRYVDAAALEFCLARIEQTPEHAPWWLYFVLLQDGGSRRMLIGTAGYKGPPDADGTVEVGYGIVEGHQRRGYASEAVGGLLDHAFAVPAVRRVIAETYAELEPSIGVLRKCGFRQIEGGSEPGVIRFERTRAEHRGPPPVGGPEGRSAPGIETRHVR